MVPIKKKDGSTRWAMDYRPLNKCLELDIYPLPKIQQLVERAGGHRVYSALDAVSINIEEDSYHCTAFTSPQVDYLRHTLSQEGIAMQESYIARILDWTAPTTPKDLLIPQYKETKKLRNIL